uniref:G2 and S-phase expressed 1 n=1 Tax=Sciurus vulgaris TaxID=55149 RepID=A0A8D2AYL9_SCIVU
SIPGSKKRERGIEFSRSFNSRGLLKIANEDDEVFFGPVGHRERCIAASLELSSQLAAPPRLPACDSACTLSPLSAEKFVEVYREARLLALQLESHSREEAQAAEPGSSSSQGVERFIQESKLKVKLFEKEQEMEKSPKSLKRETYYLSDSPFQGLPSSGEPLFQASPQALPSVPVQVGPVLTQGPPPSSRPLLGEPAAVHPLDQAVPQKRVVSKLQLPRASFVRGRHLPSAIEKPKTEVPASPSGVKLLYEKRSHGDVLLDKPSKALDTVSFPAHGRHQGQGKRSLPVPSKKTLLKPPGYTGSLTRKSSSGSVSSSTSSVCASPAAGKAESGELAGIPGSSSRPLSNASKPSRMAPAMPRQSLPAAPAGTSCRQARRADAAESMAEQPQAPSTAPLPLPQTPGSGGLRLDPNSILSPSSQPNKTGSVRRRASYLNSKASLVTKDLLHQRAASGFRLFGHLRSRLCLFLTRVVAHSTPARRSSGPASQSLSSSRGTPVSARRVSALPTPGGWRLSGLLTTPKTLPRALASPLCAPARRLSSEPRKRSNGEAVVTQEDNNRRTGGGQAGLSPDGSFSAPSSVPQTLHFSAEKNDSPFSQDFTGADQVEAKPREDTCSGEVRGGSTPSLAITCGAESTPPADLPLIDFSSPPQADVASGPASRPLTDLTTNTPDMLRNSASKPSRAEGQLIDLGSPLIQLSPEADKENVDSPLLKF